MDKLFQPDSRYNQLVLLLKLQIYKYQLGKELDLDFLVNNSVRWDNLHNLLPKLLCYQECYSMACIFLQRRLLEMNYRLHKNFLMDNQLEKMIQMDSIHHPDMRYSLQQLIDFCICCKILQLIK